MKEDRLTIKDMVGGWFIGDFEPSFLRTEAFEVGLKQYRAGDRDPPHFHKIAREITLVVSGKVRMLDEEWDTGSIIDIQPGIANEFEALTDATLVVVKVPSAKGDKYLL